MNFATLECIRRHSRATLSQRALLFDLAAYADAAGRPWPSLATLSGDLGTDASGISRLARGLQAIGEISVVKGGGRGNKTAYTILCQITRTPASLCGGNSGNGTSDSTSPNGGRAGHETLAPAPANTREAAPYNNGRDRKPFIMAGPCPGCGAPVAHRKGPRGPFYGCSTYPDCRWTGTEPPKPPKRDDPRWDDDPGSPANVAIRQAAHVDR